MGECWYPTTFFYDLEQNCTIWEIFGAEQFIRIKNKRVNYLTNDMWRMISKEEYDVKVAAFQSENKHYSRHLDYFDRFQEVSYMVSPSESELEERHDKAPELVVRSDYRLKFGSNKDLEITEGIKVVEAYIHEGEVLATHQDK